MNGNVEVNFADNNLGRIDWDKDIPKEERQALINGLRSNKMSEELKETKPAKGRKFIALIMGLIFAVLYIIGCAIFPKLLELAAFAMVVEGIIVSYMGANAVKSIKGPKK